VKNNVSRKLKPMDCAAIVLSLALVAVSARAVYGASETSARVVVQGPGRTWVFPMDAEERVAVPGPAGETVVEISGGTARVLSSPCANQTCVAAGHIHRQGEWAACLPNMVFVSIEGKADDEAPDAAAW
jgi:hypothetical protein